MKNYKTGLIIFLFLAIIISLFPPFEFRLQLNLSHSSFSDNIVYGKSYIFIFKTYDKISNELPEYAGSSSFIPGIENRRLLVDELVIEYLLAGFIALFVQIIITFAKRKSK